MRFLIKLFLVFCTFSLLVACGDKTSSAMTPDQVKDEIAKSIPSLPKIDSVNKSPINGMYEVVSGNKIYYVTMDGKYLVFGNVIEVSTKKSLTAERIQQIVHPAGK